MAIFRASSFIMNCGYASLGWQSLWILIVRCQSTGEPRFIDLWIDFRLFFVQSFAKNWNFVWIKLEYEQVLYMSLKGTLLLSFGLEYSNMFFLVFFSKETIVGFDLYYFKLMLMIHSLYHKKSGTKFQKKPFMMSIEFIKKCRDSCCVQMNYFQITINTW